MAGAETLPQHRRLAPRRRPLSSRRDPASARRAGPVLEPLAARSSRTSPGAAEGSRHAPKTVLLVDDQLDILDSLRLYLRSALPGVDVVVAPSAREALEVLEGRQVDLVITDLRMPEVDGFEFIQRLRGAEPDLPVFLMTAYAQTELAKQALASRAFQEFVAKPIDTERLVSLVRRYLQ